MPVLMDQLRKHGYPEDEITVALHAVSGGADAPARRMQFLNHRPDTAWRKIGHLITGFLVGGTVFLLCVWFGMTFSSLLYVIAPTGIREIASLLPAVFGAAVVLLLFFKFRKRSLYFARGILVALISFGVLAVVAILFLMYVVGRFS